MSEMTVYTDIKGRDWAINVFRDVQLTEDGLDCWTEIRALTLAGSHRERFRYHAAFVPSSDPTEKEMWDIIHKDLDSQDQPIPLSQIEIVKHV